MTLSYKKFLESKTFSGKSSGFEPNPLNPMLFDFQEDLTRWAIRRGRSGIFADCGMGKTPMQLEFARQIVEKTNKKVLILTPLAVSSQTVKEGEKFGIECNRSIDGKLNGNIIVTNYEKLHYFNKNDFIGVVCDESSAIKHFTGKRQKQVTEFMKNIPYRLLCTASE